MNNTDRKGNQVKILSDPVTVIREHSLRNPLYSRLYEKEREMWWSVSQETCLISKERLPKKVIFLLKENAKSFLFAVSVFLWSRHILFYGMLSKNVEPYRYRDKIWTAKQGLTDCDGIRSVTSCEYSRTAAKCEPESPAYIIYHIAVTVPVCFCICLTSSW